MTQDRDRLDTTVVVVNYRTKELTLDTVRSALREPEVREVLVVDNASGDGSADHLRAALGDSVVKVIEAPTNIGFGRAVNLAMPTARCRLVLLLNSDATLVPGAVATLAERLLADPSVALVAPAVYEADGLTLQPDSYGRFPDPAVRPFARGRPQTGPPTPDWVSGVAMMLRKDDFMELGGFDPDFQMYLEDVDLCRRIRSRGWVVAREPAAGVVHLGGRSWTSSTDKRDHYQRSKITYFRKAGLAPGRLAFLHVLRVARVGGTRLAARRTRQG